MDELPKFKSLEFKEEPIALEEGYYSYKTYKIIYQNKELIVLNRGIALHSIIGNDLRVSKSPLLIPYFYDGENELNSDIFELDDFLIFTTRGSIGKDQLSKVLKEKGKLVQLNMQSIASSLENTASTKRLEANNEENKVIIKNFQNIYELYQLNRKKIYLLLDWNTGRVIETESLYGYLLDKAYFGYSIDSKLIPLRDFAQEHGTRELKKKIQEARLQAKNFRNPPKPNL